MCRRIVAISFVLAAMLAGPTAGLAQQEAVLSGIVTDTTGGVKRNRKADRRTLDLRLKGHEDDGKPLFSAARAHMDRFEIRNHPRGGNVITISKKAK